MSKELEALERLYTSLYYAYYDGEEDFKLIKSALERLEEIDEWKTFYQIPNDEELRRYIHNGWWFETNGEKQIKALEIIKKKRVNLDLLFESFECEQQIEHYNNFNNDFWEPLTQEEYDLLKEALL